MQSRLTIVFIPGAISAGFPAMENLTEYSWLALALGLMLSRERGVVLPGRKSNAAWKSLYSLNFGYSEPGMLITTSGLPDEMKQTTGIPAPTMAGAS